MSLSATSDDRLQRARRSLEGLSIGDALGGFLEGSIRAHTSAIVANRQPPDIEWHFTDDTNMALSIYAILRQHGRIVADDLAAHFAQHYDPTRGYGPGARRLFKRVKQGDHWEAVSANMYNGGSYGNGGAMRVAPLGAYFADDTDALLENARLSSQVTHYHPEGVAGTLAVALAAGIACQLHAAAADAPERAAFIEQVLAHLPESEVTSGIRRARDINPQTNSRHAAAMLGNGSRISAQDTVPFAIFQAATYLDDYEEAIWQTMSAGGDVDTTCAMVGGIVACYTGIDAIPQAWRDHREELPAWAFEG